jgi:hypothetical protein
MSTRAADDVAHVDALLDTTTDQDADAQSPSPCS